MIFYIYELFFFIKTKIIQVYKSFIYIYIYIYIYINIGKNAPTPHQL